MKRGNTMAKINGWEIKGMVCYKGHGGEPLRQCNVYYNGKKVGYYSDGDWGGENTLELPATFEKECSEEFVWELMQLKDYESDYKKAVKKGHDCLAVYDKTEWTQAIFTCRYEHHKDQITELAKKAKAEKSLKFYRSMADFNITRTAQPKPPPGGNAAANRAASDEAGSKNEKGKENETYYILEL